MTTKQINNELLLLTSDIRDVCAVTALSWGLISIGVFADIMVYRHIEENFQTTKWLNRKFA